MVICYIGIGSNIGDRRQYIEAAVRRLKTLNATKVRRISGIIESAAQGGPRQGPYLNAVAEIETGLHPYELLQELQRIEALLGRVRTMIDGPRQIDLDILTFGDVRMDEAALSIPHPRMLERAFVLLPMQEIAPQAVSLARRLLQAGRRSKKAPARRRPAGRSKKPRTGRQWTRTGKRSAKKR